MFLLNFEKTQGAMEKAKLDPCEQSPTLTFGYTFKFGSIPTMAAHPGEHGGTFICFQLLNYKVLYRDIIEYYRTYIYTPNGRGIPLDP